VHIRLPGLAKNHATATLTATQLKPPGRQTGYFSDIDPQTAMLTPCRFYLKELMVTDNITVFSHTLTL